MKAIIMAGGEGSRLRPLTCDLPKPMVPIMNIPIMEHIIELLKSHGIKEIGVTLAFLPQKIKNYFGNGSSFGVNLHYFTEDSPLGTAGSVKNAQDFLDDTFIVISGDSLTNINLSEAINFHRSKNSKATLALTRVNVPLEYGVVITDSQNAITGFLEKPSWGEVFSDTVNTGTYILEPDVLNYLESGKKLDFSQDLFPALLAKKEPIFGYIMSGYWCDIGDLEAYLQAHCDILEGKIKVKLNAVEVKKGVWIGAGTIIEPNALINGPCVIGSNCRIGNGTVVDSFCVIGNNNVIEDDVSIKRSVIWNGSYIDYGSEIRGAILCNRVNLKQYVSAFEGTVIGDDCVIHSRAILKPKVKVWPQKIVDSLSIVDRNIIWGTRHARAIFGESGLSGIINVDISPEFATRLGAAYGSMFKKGSKVVVSSTRSNSSRMFKHAFISGMLSVGVEVFNLSSMLTPISRHAISFLSVEGGIHIKLSGDNPNKLKVDFMDSKGASISRVLERKIENAFFREDFKRCSGDEISRLNNITDFKNYYVRSVLNDIDVHKIREKSPKINIVSSSDFVISLVVAMLSDVGCKVISFSYADQDNLNSIVEEMNENAADFTAFIDSNGETLVLIDKSGNIIKDDLFLVLTSLIVFESLPHSEVIVPITAPSTIENLAKKYEGKVMRTKTSPQAVMQQMLNYNLFKNNEREKMTQFMLNFDALAGLVKIIEYLCVRNTSLAETLSKMPPFYISKRSIHCPWELKGKVMRTLITQSSNNTIELLDGIKVMLQNGWVLVIPDADLPLCRVYSEGESPEAADAISKEYLEKIRMIIDET
jgi:mannose-1-phosphate guanylyltransferase/phosphomannomutase